MRVVSENYTKEFMGMAVGETVACPASKYGIVNSILCRLRVEGMDTGVNFSMRTNRVERRIEVTRTS